jgi:putative ABC transport system permease protein
VVGVIDSWAPLPRYYKLVGGEPSAPAKTSSFPFQRDPPRDQHNGGMNCTRAFGPATRASCASECTWIQFWFETASGGDRAELQTYLDNYAAEQRKLGRLKRAAPNKLYDVNEWMD